MRSLYHSIKKQTFALLALVFLFSAALQAQKQEKRTQFVIHTSMGDMYGELFNETPMHKANFIKLVKAGWYENSYFHRVINHFMIQGGQNADGREDENYTVPAEFLPEKFVHIKGMLAAAREGDDVNPTKASSAAQFYIVQGKQKTLGQLMAMENKINAERKKKAIENYILFPGNEKWYYQADALMRAKDANGLKALHQQVYAEMQAKGEAPTLFRYSQEQKKLYMTIGGTPHLDGAYTVYGRITKGLDVLDKIAASPVVGSRPIEKVFMKIEILD